MAVLAAAAMALAACGDERAFVDACMADGMAVRKACECTYERLKADRRHDVIEAVIRHANDKHRMGLGEPALTFAGTYLRCQL